MHYACHINLYSEITDMILYMAYGCIWSMHIYGCSVMTMCERVGTKGEHVPVDNHHIDLTILSERKKDVVHFCFRKKHAQRSQSGNVWVIGVQVSN